MLGSRGDIQPYVAIGLHLVQAGYRVRIMTNPSATHRELVAQFAGLTLVPFSVDVERHLAQDDTARQAMAAGDLFGLAAWLHKLDTLDTARGAQFITELRSKDHRPDLLIVSHLTDYFGIYAAHHLQIPTLKFDLQSMSYEDRAPMGLPNLPFGLHRYLMQYIMTVIYASYVIFDQRMGLIPGECSILQKVLPKHFFVQGSFTATYQPLLPNYVCQSPVLRNILCPHISPHIQFIGAATIPKELQVQVITSDSSSTHQATSSSTTRSASFGGTKTQAQIKAFLTAAAADDDNDNAAATNSKGVVYMGWGSMISISSETMVVFAVETLRECQQRGIVLGGWANLNMQTLERATQDATIVDYARKNVLFIDTAPHEWLFPQCSCIVHHGGAGTTAGTFMSVVLETN